MHCRVIDIVDAGEVEEKVEKRIKVGDDKDKKGKQISGGNRDPAAHHDIGQKGKKREVHPVCLKCSIKAY